MKFARFLILSLLLVLTARAAERQLQAAVAEVINKPSQAAMNSLKANGLVFTAGSDTLLVTVGHEFESGSANFEIVLNSGDRVRGVLDSNYYDDANRESTDVAVVRLERNVRGSDPYIWQNGLLLERALQPGVMAQVYNGREVVDGYEVVAPITANSVTLRSPPNALTLGGMSGGLVACGALVVGLVRDVTTDGLIHVLRIDAITQLIKSDDRPLPCGDALVLARAAHATVETGEFPTALRALDAADVLLKGFAGTKADEQAAVNLVRVEYNLCQGNLYDAEQALLLLRDYYDTRNAPRKRALTRMLQGRCWFLGGYRFTKFQLEGKPDIVKQRVQFWTDSMDKAAGAYKEAVDMLREQPDTILLAQALIGYAKAIEDKDYEAALRALREAQDLSNPGSPKDVLSALYRIMDINAALGIPTKDELSPQFGPSLSEREKAEVLLNNHDGAAEAARLYGKVGTPYEVANAYETAGDFAQDTATAQGFYQRAMDLYRASSSLGPAFSLRLSWKASLRSINLTGMPGR